jgi:hypothetical protein
MWFHAMTQGRGEDDYTSLIQMIEQWAGVVVGGNESGLSPSSSPAKAGDPATTGGAVKHQT